MYNLLFDEVPFSFVDAKEAIKKYKDPNFYYEIFRKVGKLDIKYQELYHLHHFLLYMILLKY